MTEIVINASAPPAGNKVRRIDWKNHKSHAKWRDDFWWRLVQSKIRGTPKGLISGAFEIEVTVSNDAKTDLDSSIKQIIDACVVYGLVPDDSPKYMRKITLQWGSIPEGIRVVLRDFPA